MAKGRKTGGRTLGTPNKSTYEIVAVLEQLGCDPIAGMARIAMNPRNKPELRGRMFAELATYVHPRRKAIEDSPPDSGPAKTAVTEEQIARMEALKPNELTLFLHVLGLLDKGEERPPLLA